MDDSIALRKLQLETLEILKMFKAYCEKHELTWFLLSGTALGAMRHGGFIPWDDDLDVGMPREDYERFLSLARSDLPDGLHLDAPGIEPALAPMFSKLCLDGTVFETQETIEAGYSQGIFVDIIPLDRLAKDDGRSARQKNNSRFWQSMSYLWHAKTIVVPDKGVLGAVERTACRVAHYVVKALFPKSAILKHYRKSIIDDHGELSENWILLSWPHTKPFPTDVLMPVSYCAFEGLDMPVPGQPERYLELMYGDWNRLPPEDQRHTHLPLRIVYSDGSVWTRRQ